MKSNDSGNRKRNISTAFSSCGLGHSAGLEDESLLDEDPYYFSAAALSKLEEEEEEEEEWEEEEDMGEDSSAVNTEESEDNCICGVEDELLSDIEDDISSEATSLMAADELSICTETSGIGLEDSLTKLSLLHNGRSTELDQRSDSKSDHTADVHLHPYRLSLPKSDTPVAVSEAPGRVCATAPASTTSMEREVPGEEGGVGVRGAEPISPALTPSLFPCLPPTIHFPLHNEKCEWYIMPTAPTSTMNITFACFMSIKL